MNKSCYLCKSTNLTERQGCVRDIKTLKILECADCGLAFLSSFDHINENFYEDSNMFAQKIEIEELVRACKTDDERRYKQYEELIVNKDILDFGCGCAGFLDRAKARAKNCYGLELERRFKKYYEDLNLTVFADTEEVTKKFDVIFMFHVLEHIKNPIETLQKIKSMLKGGGRLIIEVPNANDALLSLYKNKEFSNFTYWSPHLFLYNQHTLQTLMSQAGYQTEYIKQFQRYSVANHMHWLAKGLPGGHEKWNFLDNQELGHAYEKTLAQLGLCDTVIGSFYV